MRPVAIPEGDLFTGPEIWIGCGLSSRDFQVLQEGKLVPAHKSGGGKGAVRLFDFEVFCQVAILASLYRGGMSLAMAARVARALVDSYTKSRGRFPYGEGDIGRGLRNRSELKYDGYRTTASSIIASALEFGCDVDFRRVMPSDLELVLVKDGKDQLIVCSRPADGMLYANGDHVDAEMIVSGISRGTKSEPSVQRFEDTNEPIYEDSSFRGRALSALHNAESYQVINASLAVRRSLVSVWYRRRDA